MKPNVVDEADEDDLVAEAEVADEPEACYETNTAIETVPVASPAVAAAVVASALCGNLC